VYSRLKNVHSSAPEKLPEKGAVNAPRLLRQVARRLWIAARAAAIPSKAISMPIDMANGLRGFTQMSFPAD
jgi:hypothetical protein